MQLSELKQGDMLLWITNDYINIDYIVEIHSDYFVRKVLKIIKDRHAETYSDSYKFAIGDINYMDNAAIEFYKPLTKLDKLKYL